MYRYKLLAKKHWFLILLIIIAIVLCMVWTNNILWIENHTRVI